MAGAWTRRVVSVVTGCVVIQSDGPLVLSEGLPWNLDAWEKNIINALKSTRLSERIKIRIRSAQHLPLRAPHASWGMDPIMASCVKTVRAHARAAEAAREDTVVEVALAAVDTMSAGRNNSART